MAYNPHTTPARPAADPCVIEWMEEEDEALADVQFMLSEARRKMQDLCYADLDPDEGTPCVEAAIQEVVRARNRLGEKYRVAADATYQPASSRLEIMIRAARYWLMTPNEPNTRTLRRYVGEYSGAAEPEDAA